MIIVQVAFKIKNNMTDDFIKFTKKNVSNSLLEEGVDRFEFYKVHEKENLFILFEIYKTIEDQMKHRETMHFKNWKNNISGLLEESYAISILEKL